MLELYTGVLELRGIKNAVSKKSGNTYYTVHCEDDGGESQQFFARDCSGFAQGLKKGDMVRLTLSCNKYGNLEVIAIHPAE